MKEDICNSVSDEGHTVDNIELFEAFIESIAIDCSDDNVRHKEQGNKSDYHDSDEKETGANESYYGMLALLDVLNAIIKLLQLGFHDPLIPYHKFSFQT